MKQIHQSLLAAALLACGVAQAGVVITVNDVAGTVVFDSSGSLNLAGATAAQSGGNFSLGFIAGGSNWYIGMGSGGAYQGYEFTAFDGPFGTNLNFVTNPTLSIGDDFSIWGQGGATEQVVVSSSYVSGAAISSRMEFSGTSIAALTMIAGTYTYTLPNDTITLIIGGGGNRVPEPASLALVGVGLLGLASLRRSKV